ncbi:TPA: hypothetical protein H1016_04670 [archaeon]|uniref:CARDB domain-containing protein n=1 Tax=Candidatus Naiadarchaeum limnaeum TaxID=2756139 RepID=A0A832XM67_9ARCH|nr:hypothetical protein [Candidatus Naiadarchaeum limnaeum]
MGAIKNVRAQIEIVGLALLVAGVTTIASAGLLSVGGGAQARAEFTKNFLLMENTLEGMELFYNDMIEIATHKALEEQGHDMENFCAAAVQPTDSLKNLVIDKAENLVSQYVTYKGQNLPHMRTIDGKVGTLDLKVVDEGTWTKGDEKIYWFEDEVVYEYPKEYYVTEINTNVTLGGEVFRTDVIAEAFDLAGKKSCEYTFRDIPVHDKRTATFSCEGMVKKIKAHDTGWVNWVDLFEAAIKTPGLGYLEVNGKPAEKMEVQGGGTKISSSGAFSTQIKTTADARPDLTVNFVRVKDSSGNIITSVEAKQAVTIEAEFANLGCAKVNKNSKVRINAAGSNILDTTTGSFGYTEKRIITATWTPQEAGTPLVSASIDIPDNVVTESNEGNNQKSLSFTVSGAPDLRITASDLKFNATPTVGKHFSLIATFRNAGTSSQLGGGSTSIHVKNSSGAYAGCFSFGGGVSGQTIGIGSTYDLKINNCKANNAGTYTAYAKFVPNSERSTTRSDNEVTKTFTVS